MESYTGTVPKINANVADTELAQHIFKLFVNKILIYYVIQNT